MKFVIPFPDGILKYADGADNSDVIESSSGKLLVQKHKELSDDVQAGVQLSDGIVGPRTAQLEGELSQPVKLSAQLLKLPLDIHEVLLEMGVSVTGGASAKAPVIGR